MLSSEKLARGSYLNEFEIDLHLYENYCHIGFAFVMLNKPASSCSVHAFCTTWH